MASFLYDDGSNRLLVGGATAITWGSDTIKARLVASSVTPVKTDTAMTGYTAIGTDQSLASFTGPTKDTTNHRSGYFAANPTWTAVAGGSTIGFVVVYKFITNDAGSIPIALLDVADTSTNGGNITVTWDATGVFYLQE